MKTTHRILGICSVVLMATLVLAAGAGATHYYIQDGAPTGTWGLTANVGWENMTTTAPTSSPGPVDYFQLGAYYAGTAAMTLGQGPYVCLEPMKAEIWFENKRESITNTVTVKLQKGTFGTAGTTLATATAQVTTTTWTKKTFDFGHLGISLNNQSLILEITCSGTPADCNISWAGSDHPSALLWGTDLQTIYEIQNGTIPPGAGVEVGCAIVTAAPYEYTTTGAYCFVMAPGGGPYSGVEVYWGSAKAPIYGGLHRGDGVYITGVTGEYYDMTEIDMSGEGDTLIVGSSGNPLPGPDDVSIGDAFDEAWEGVLVRLNCTEVYDLFDYGEWGIHDAAGDSGRVDDKSLTLTYSPFVGDWKDLIGIMTYSYGNYVLWPRDDADIIETDPTAVEPTSWGNIKHLYR